VTASWFFVEAELADRPDLVIGARRDQNRKVVLICHRAFESFGAETLSPGSSGSGGEMLGQAQESSGVSCAKRIRFF